MTMSDDELKAKFAEYELAGKFDYMAAFDINRIVGDTRTKNVLNNLHNFYMFAHLGTDKISQLPFVAPSVMTQLAKELKRHRAFVFKQDHPSLVIEGMPTFADLLTTGQLDDYLVEGERIASIVNPNWRTECLPDPWRKNEYREQKTFTDTHLLDLGAALGSDNKQQPVAVIEKDDEKEKFIIDYIAKSVNRIGRSFETPLDRVHPLFGGDTIRELNGKTNAEGETLDFLGDLVLVGRQKLVETFGVNEEQIAVLDKTLPMYRLSLDMRDEAEAVYNQEITNADQPTASDDAQRQDKKKADFKTYFTAP